MLATVSERRQRATLRIVFLNADPGIDQRLDALALGFDDALPLSVAPDELVGRIRLMLGGAYPPLLEPRQSDIAPGIQLDLAARRVLRDGRDVHLRPKEFALLALLASDPGRVYTRDELVDLVWGGRYRGNVRTVDVHVRWLRAKLETDPAHPRHVITVRGTGYRLDPVAS
jgi:two-component system response regulator RegX3